MSMADCTDAELIGQIAEFKQKLTKKWRAIFHAHKEQNKVKSKPESPSKLRLPFIPDDLKSNLTTEDASRDHMRRTLVKMFQTPPNDRKDF